MSTSTMAGDNADNSTVSNKDIMELLQTVAKDVKSNKESLKALETKHYELAETVSGHDTRISSLESKYNALIEKENKRIRDVEQLRIDALFRDMMSKRWNIHVFNMTEAAVWESKEQSLDVVLRFLRDVLKIPHDIAISDAHRLPNSATTTRTGPRPLIFKLQKLFDKKLIADNLKNLKQYNENLPVGKRVFVELDHLPQRWKDDKRSLKDEAKEARQSGLKPRFKPNRVTGEYCLYIGNNVLRPKPSSPVRNDIAA